MEYGELYIPRERATRNAVTGQFLKGNVPHNKGKHWSDYMGKRKQKRCAKGWRNVMEHRHVSNAIGELRKQQVVAVGYKGNWVVFPTCTEAAKWCGSTASNISRCCRWNKDRRKTSDYKVKGIRFYYEDDNIWTTKITT